MSHEVEIDRPGTYNVIGRYAELGGNAGTVQLDLGQRTGAEEPVELETTTEDRAFVPDDWGQVRLTPGTHALKVRFGGGAEDVSLDYLQLDRVANPGKGHQK